MSNFAFVKDEWPELYQECVRAEGYLVSDPRSACFYARRVVELLVDFIYQVERLRMPYRDDLAAKIAEPEFRNRITAGIGQKLTLIRKNGNHAVHHARPVPPQTAAHILTELHHIMIWAAYRYSARPNEVPQRAVFDPSLARRQAPLGHDEVVKLAARFREQDEKHKRELAERDQLAAEKDAEIERLRAQIAAGQATKTVPEVRDYGEAETRKRIIDEYLKDAGWTLDQPRDREYRLTGMPTTSGSGYADYVLWGHNGLPLAVIEAKRTSAEASYGQHQAKLYADCLEQETGQRPVIFYTNGYDIWLWDDAAGYPPRPVQGFYTRDELELAIQRRSARGQLADTDIDTGIAGRSYQQRAIRAVGETFTAKQRAALLVMATGTGKTRTAVALVDQLMRAGWVKRVLFLADRRALVKQAVGAFKTHLPDVATINLVTEKDKDDGWIYAATYPTMMNIVETAAEQDGGRTFGPGYFDLIIIDEAHRSVYQKYRGLFGWFDSLLLGLTATPKDEVDRNTYTLFDLEDGVPTDAYSLEDAVADGYLVPPRTISVPTAFMQRGIHYDELSDEEKDEWDEIEWGEGGFVPDHVEAEALGRFLFNADTVDQVLATLMEHGHYVAGGDRIGKTIIFAASQKHADFIVERFNRAYPEGAGHWARVITHAVDYAEALIDDFSEATKAPYIAVSVDMLDTGIDIPEVVNLVFFKPVRSKAKFWQMIGRGTRLRPDLYGPGKDKTDFLVFDVCGNLEFFRQDLPEAAGRLQKSLTTQLVEQRLELLFGLASAGIPHRDDLDPATAEETEEGLRLDLARVLHRRITSMNPQHFLVRPARRYLDRYSDWSQWATLTREKADEVARHLAPLPAADTDSDEDAKRFDLLILKIQSARLEGDAKTETECAGRVRQIAGSLLGRLSIPAIRAHEELLRELAGEAWWVDVSLPMLERVRRRLRGIVRLVDKRGRNAVYADFQDERGALEEIDIIGHRSSVGFAGAAVDMERFREKALEHLRQHESNIALQRLRRNRQLTSADLDALEQMLIDAGVGSQEHLERAAEESEGLGLFIRSLIGLDRQAAIEAFNAYSAENGFSASQLRFIELIIEQLTANGVMEPGRLWEPPFVDYAPQGPEMLFSDEDVDGIVTVLQEVRKRAVPAEAQAGPGSEEAG